MSTVAQVQSLTQRLAGIDVVSFRSSQALTALQDLQDLQRMVGDYERMERTQAAIRALLGQA